MGGILAIDLGEKKSGFAYADPTRTVVRPLDGLRAGEASDGLVSHLRRLVEERDVATILLGVPWRAGGEASERTRRSQAFAEHLRGLFPRIEVCVHDEKLTTKEAEALLHEAGYRGREARARRDSWSALVLLRDWIAAGEPR